MKPAIVIPEVTKIEFWTLYRICEYVACNGTEHLMDPARGFGYQTWEHTIGVQSLILRVSPRHGPLEGPNIHSLRAETWNWHWSGKSTHLGNLQFSSRENFDRELIYLKMATNAG